MSARIDELIWAFDLPDDTYKRAELWGEMIFQTLPALLLRTCNGELATIRELVLDRAVPEYVRFAAIEALTFAVGLGMTGREEVVPYCSSSVLQAALHKSRHARASTIDYCLESNRVKIYLENRVDESRPLVVLYYS